MELHLTHLWFWLGVLGASVIVYVSPFKTYSI